jgi:hypothetical protein
MSTDKTKQLTLTDGQDTRDEYRKPWFCLILCILFIDV